MQNYHRYSFLVALTVGSLSVSSAIAQITLPTAAKAVTTQSMPVAVTDSVAMQLDKAVSANASRDKAATVQALQGSTAALEAEAQKSTPGFKDKLLAQAGNLKKLIPLAESGLLGGGVIQKAAGLAKLALGGSQIESALGGASLLSQVGSLTSSLNVVKGGLSALGGSTQTSGNSLISGALSSVSKLSSVGAPAEPAVRSQLGSVLSMVKGVL